MKATPWLLAALLAVAACEDKGTEKPAPAQDKKTETTKPDAKQADKKADEGDTKQAKTETSTEDAKMLTEKSTKLLEALKGKNVDAIAEFVPEKERAEAKKSFAEGGSAYKSFFVAGEWRNKAITTWDGKIQAMRIKDDKAHVKFGETENKEAAVVEWVKEDEQWWFKDVLSPSLEDFDKWGNEIK